MGACAEELRSRFRAGGFQTRNPIPLKIRRVWSLLHTKSYVVANRRDVEVWRRGASPVVVLVIRQPQNSPRVATKRDINITKLNQTFLKFLLCMI
ncbi:hypothetical protein AVEN_109171-1 [Araneus ventricosus]|uniref:Uncharacterized protein n=1 Tax=Araneus ventricosus TaxID=182803 RepID=A0A4Y2JHG9_ARAVE|nr:hypothetical protein AVEN_109171-1 [Araneus ventricosus]